jgi:hypothetical protein
MGMLALAKRERKTNYSVDGYFKETMRAGPSKPDKPAKMPKAPKQVNVYVLVALHGWTKTHRSPVTTSNSSLRGWRNSKSRS